MRLVLICLAFAALLPYAQTLRFGYVYDDVPIIRDNAALHGPAGLLRAWTVPYWPDDGSAAGLYRPVTQFVYAALWNAGGGSATAFHLYAVALHAVVTLGVCLLLARALPIWAAIGGALLFAVHPVHVEAVANITGSAELLTTLAVFAFIAVLWRAMHHGTPGGAVDWPLAALAGIAYALAIGAKESAAALPAIAAVWWWGWRRPSKPHDAECSFAGVLRRGWRVWVATAAMLAIMVGARYVVLGTLVVQPDAVAVGIRGADTAQRVWTMLAAWPLVGQLLIWPSSLSMHYGPSIVRPYAGPTARALLAIGMVTAAALTAIVLARRGDRRPAAALAWIGLAYFPASNLLAPTGQLLAERTLYLPTVGVAMLVAWGLEALARALRQALTAPRAALAVGISTAAFAAVAATRTARASMVWRDNYTLFTSGLAADPLAYRLHHLLATWYVEHGDAERGSAHMDRAYALWPRDPSLAFDHARLLLALGRAERALVVLEAAAGDAPRSQPLRALHLSTLLDTHGPDSVIADIRARAAGDPVGTTRYLFLARAFAVKGERDSVAAAYRAATEELPGDSAVRFLYAGALFRAGRLREAEREFRRVEAFSEIPPGVRHRLRGEIALALGDTVAARRAIERARAALPSDTTVARLAALLVGR